MITSSVSYKDLIVEHIYNSKLKHSYIRIDANSKIVVKTPSKSQKFVLELLQEKEQWIMKHLQKNETRSTPSHSLEDEVLLFGELYSVDSSEADFLREKLHRLKKSNMKSVLASYNDYYKHESNRYITPRVEQFAKTMGLDYSSLKYRKMRSRWGSCSSKKVITLNSELMKLKKELIDYVIVHELSHLTHMNHSKAFHSLVDSYLPNSKMLRKELKSIRLL